MGDEPAFNHVGHCVTDLERSIAFYRDLLGFEVVRELTVPDEPSDQLLMIERPVGLEAVYLQLGGMVLELLHFDRPDNPGARRRVFNEPGLTHISVSVADIRASADRAVELGGSIVEGTDIGAAILIRDPDGQMIELLPMSYRQAITAAQES